jgi:hypothetical protein
MITKPAPVPPAARDQIGLTCGAISLRLNVLPHTTSRLIYDLKLQAARLGRIRVYSEQQYELVRKEAIRRGLVQAEESP